MRLPRVTIYTGAACAGARGHRGGWAYVLTRTAAVKAEASGMEASATQMQMGLQAAIEGLRALEQRSEVEVRSDLEYIVNGMNNWLRRWRNHKWKTAEGGPVKNRGQWEELDALSQKHIVKWTWVRGHSGDPDNERCHFLARQEANIPEGVEPWWQLRKQEKAGALHRYNTVEVAAAPVAIWDITS